MKEKLRLLMESEQLRSGQLAERLEINPAAISHLLSGRNKPGFDLLQRILRRFPRISPDWLLLNSGPMYRTNGSAPDTPVTPPSSSGHADEPVGGLFDIVSGITPSDDEPANSDIPTLNVRPSTTGSKPTAGTASARVARIVIFYDDRTFETYAPRMR